jgi:NRAMP (natural resistance-associated macrophage protein)-like metal ion transporter
MKAKLIKLWKSLGPGLITGASDDEPSAIATYTMAGAKYGLSVLWMSLYSLPFMISIQEMAARIGRISGKGLAGNMKLYYPRWLLLSMAVLVVSVNTINIGSDMAGMADALALAIPSLPEKQASIIMTFVILITTVVLPYKKIFAIFKWLALILFSYILSAMWIDIRWQEIFYHVFVPNIFWTKDFFIIMAAFFGTTIAPYMFFWQANQEVEERLIEQCKPGRVCRLRPIAPEELRKLRIDTRVGMTFSNLITFFIIILSSATLFNAGLHNIESLKDAATALQPLAGDYAYLLFTLGILSSGFLAIPILAGSAAYVLAEVFGWEQGLNKTFTKAKEFYTVIIASTLIGLLIPLLGINPIKALFYTAIIYGIISPIVIGMILHMANNEKIMGSYTNGPVRNLIGGAALVVMSLAAVFATWSLF